MTVDGKIDELAGVLLRAGVAPPVPRPVVMVLDEIDAAVAPFRLPSAARRLWKRVDPTSFAVTTYPELTTPELALGGWRLHQKTDLVPARLFPLCYTSWAYVFVELHAVDVADGGALFEWMYGGADFQLAFDDIEEWLDVVARAVTAGETEFFQGRLQVPWMGERALIDVGRDRLSRRGPHGIYGTTTAIRERDWPERWR
jgi:hypothetical protein